MNIEYVMYAQVGVEVLLVLLLLALLVRGRRPPDDPARMPEALKNTIERFLAESEKIAAAFDRNLKDKKNLSADLLLKLDRRLAEYKQLLRAAEESFALARQKAAEAGQPAAGPAPVPAADKANPAAPEVRALVLQLAKKGLGVEEIAARAKLHRGEVELLIDLERQFNV